MKLSYKTERETGFLIQQNKVSTDLFRYKILGSVPF